MTEKPEPIDAHVQWNGVSYQNYRTRQPQLRCQFEDHRTCKELTAKLEGERQAELDAAAAVVKAQEQRELEQLTAQALEDRKKAVLDLAVRLRSEAVMAMCRELEAARQAAREKAAAAISAAQLAEQEARRAAELELERALEAAEQGYFQANDEMKSVDWKERAMQRVAELEAAAAEPEEPATPPQPETTEGDPVDDVVPVVPAVDVVPPAAEVDCGCAGAQEPEPAAEEAPGEPVEAPFGVQEPAGQAEAPELPRMPQVPRIEPGEATAGE